jgi:hemoglobin-like flavoprotein
MTPTEQDLVRASFAELAGMPEVAGALFYERLFGEHPEFRPMFKHDMRAQGVKLVTMLALVVDNLHQPEEVLQALRELSLRHVEYGVKPADYDAVRDALIWMFEQALGDEFSAKAKSAWAACYDALAIEMKTAAAGREASGVR